MLLRTPKVGLEIELDVMVAALSRSEGLGADKASFLPLADSTGIGLSASGASAEYREGLGGRSCLLVPEKSLGRCLKIDMLSASYSSSKTAESLSY